MKKLFSRQEIQSILESNVLGASVSYMDRENNTSPDNVIVYYRLVPNTQLFADDGLHIIKASIQVVHYHKRKLDNIQVLMIENFGCLPNTFDFKEPETDYFVTYYSFEIFAKGEW